MGALEAHDANAALGQALEQIADSRLAERNAGQVEDDRSADEKVGRVPAPLVHFGQPRAERRGRREHERHEGAAAESHRCLGSNGSRTCHKETSGTGPAGLSRLARLVVNERLTNRIYRRGSGISNKPLAQTSDLRYSADALTM